MTNLETIVTMIGNRVTLRQIARERWVGLCPFHNEKTASFYIYQNARYYCHGCGASGDAIQWLRDTENLTFREAKMRLGQPIREDPVVVRERRAQQDRAHRRTIKLNSFRDRHPDSCLPDWIIDA